MNKEKLIEDNMNLVYFLVHKYFPKYGFDEDVVQEGMLGLTKAADNWDAERSKFSGYASHYIIGYILKYLRKQNKHKGLLSLDTLYVDGEFNKKMALEEITPDVNADADFEMLFDEEFIDKLTPVDQTIIKMSRDGYNRESIAKVTNYCNDTITKRRNKIKREWVKYNERD